MKIFIADESVSFRSVLGNSLKDLTGAEIVGLTDDCNEAIHAINVSRPDVIILNIGLKSGTGADVLTGIKKRRNTFPVAIMLANHPYTQAQRMLLAPGAEYFLHKATQFGDIISVIKDLIASNTLSKAKLIGDSTKLCCN